MIKQLFDLRWKRCSAGSRGRKAVGRNFGEDRQDRLEGKNIWGQVTPILQLSKAKENIQTQVIINMKNQFLDFGILLVYSQLADISSAGQSDKQQQNKSLFSSKLLQFTGSSTHPKTYRRKQKTKNLELYKDPKKFNFFKNCNSVALKTLKTMIRCDISGSMRRLTFRGSRLKTKSIHTESWLPWNRCHGII